MKVAAKGGWLPLLQPILAVAAGLAAGLAVAGLAGESPWHVLKILARSAFGSPYDLGMSLFYATPLIFTGLAVALPLKAGLFNIGAEGQLTLGALAAAAVGALFPAVPWPWAPLLAGLAAFAAGAFWGFIPGWLRVRRGSHEVINTIMLNFIAAGLASWVTLYLLKNPASQNPETRDLGAGYAIAKLHVFGDAPVSSALFLALLAAAAVWVFLWKTVAGFEVRAVGENDVAARKAGIRDGRARILVMVLAGGLAGLVGIGEVLGNAGRFRLGFSPDFGFIGIAVALLARGRPEGVVAAGLLFGALHKGSADLDLETENVTRDLSLILQALVILSVSADGLWDWLKKRRTAP
ncbi:MAG: ABC transporter permease [Oligoflexia bacterium]|nr:ABC transporter permease [Oligoflexia bacterium]